MGRAHNIDTVCDCKVEQSVCYFRWERTILKSWRWKRRCVTIQAAAYFGIFVASLATKAIVID